MKSNKLYSIPNNPKEDFIINNTRYIKTNDNEYCASHWDNKLWAQYDLTRGFVKRISKKEFEQAKHLFLANLMNPSQNRFIDFVIHISKDQFEAISKHFTNEGASCLAQKGVQATLFD